MDSNQCANCQSAGDLICYCSSIVLCKSCVGQHMLDFPRTLHRPVPLCNKSLRNLITSSLPRLKSKESEILTQACTSLALEKACKSRITQEISSISAFCNNSILKLQTYINTLKSDLDEISQELQNKIKSSCETYKNAIESDEELVKRLKKQETLENIQNFEISSFICTFSPVNLRKILNENFFFDASPQNSFMSNLQMLSSSLSDVSQSVDSTYWKRTRTRVPTKSSKKILDSHTFAADENRVIIYNSLSKEYDSLQLEVNKGSVCTVTHEGSVVFTGGFNSKSVFLYEWSKKSLEQVSDMKFERSFHSAVSLGDFIYVIGGAVSAEPTKSCERFDIIHKTWQSIGDLTHARHKHSSCVYRGRIFVAGGVNNNTLEVYNTVSNKFSVLRTTLSSPGPCLMFPVEDFMIIFHSNLVSSFDPAKLTSQTLLNLDEDDWYINGNIVVHNKVASFIRNGRVVYYDVESAKWV